MNLDPTLVHNVRLYELDFLVHEKRSRPRKEDRSEQRVMQHIKSSEGPAGIAVSVSQGNVEVSRGIISKSDHCEEDGRLSGQHEAHM